MAFPLNSDLSKGFTIPQVAQKHGWPEPMVWSQAMNKYAKQSISGLSRTNYLKFLERFFLFLKKNIKEEHQT
ncbi:MAG: hypothetical protein KKD21_12065 [Proteobacteria bacterium]|nr:hypothetical protein [Pseudomonadota bacterium]MBU1697758.1 hypothetical protein [Pseudomonadota bacterium]